MEKEEEEKIKIRTDYKAEELIHVFLVDREQWRRRAASAAEPQHTQPAHPVVAHFGQVRGLIKSFTQYFIYIQSAATNSKRFSSRGTTGRPHTHQTLNLRLNLKENYRETK